MMLWNVNKEYKFYVFSAYIAPIAFMVSDVYGLKGSKKDTPCLG